MRIKNPSILLVAMEWNAEVPLRLAVRVALVPIGALVTLTRQMAERR